MNTFFIDPYAVSTFIVHKTPETCKYLLLHRCGKYLPKTWQMVTGKVHTGEKAWQTALREVQEETGLVLDNLYSADAIETFYYAIEDKIALVPVFVAFIENMEGVRLSPTEHDAYEWLPFEEARDRLVWSEQKRIISLIHQTFIVKDPNPLLLIKG